MVEAVGTAHARPHAHGEPRRWLVTGAAGFIGSNLCERLLDAGHTVVGFDDFHSGKRAHIARLTALAPDRFRLIEASVTDAAALAAACDGVAVVAHLAAQVSVQRSLDDPLTTNTINVTGFLNALQAAGAAGCRHFLYASSCSVYGDQERLPITEDHCPRPLSPYAASKLVNEFYAASLAPHWPGMAVTGFRFFNAYGPWQDPSGGYAAVIPKWINLCLAGQQPTIHGDGSATRDFCYVGDICRALMAAAQQEPPRAATVLNIGTGAATSLGTLFDTVHAAVSATGTVLPFRQPRFEPWRAGEIVHSVADASRAEAVLGFRTETSLRAGIRAILAVEYGFDTQPADRR